MSGNTKLSWPVRTIDFEASSLEDGSYPIEVGVAVWPREDDPITVWSTLIRPTDDWRRFGHWSLASRKVHGIAMSELAGGAQPAEVAKALNETLGDGFVWCDGGAYDAHWLRTLFGAAGIRPSFILGNWAGLLRTLPERCRQRAMAAVEEAPPRHRAGADAEQLLRALAAGIAA
ncbi:hypothetical protein V5F31_16020 [Xanthobacter sp. V7C-4]|uniref:3'-5' exonuclease n=1 Tax=Xanthobacter autotrophicus (strain ATCC BAA-1158 / Py2) TaxID=78245 RepID=UPI00372C65BC